MRKFVVLVCALSVSAHAGVAAAGTTTSENLKILSEIPANLDQLSGPEYDFADPENEFNPYASDAAEALKAFDEAYSAQTGEAPKISENEFADLITQAGGCYQASCPVFAHVSKASQTLTLYINGEVADRWRVSTGKAGHGTPNINKTATGRIYEQYTSSKYPDGDYNGLGNMPYAVFISGGIALHGTTRGNWKRLGSAASHGCVRLHPEHARAFNRLVRANGPSNVWVLIN